MNLYFVILEEGDFPRGTRVTFKPDPEIFKTTLEFDFDKVAARMDELAYLNAGLTIQMTDFRKAIAKGAAAEKLRADLAARESQALAAPAGAAAAAPVEEGKAKSKKPKEAKGKLIKQTEDEADEEAKILPKAAQHHRHINLAVILSLTIVAGGVRLSWRRLPLRVVPPRRRHQGAGEGAVRGQGQSA